MEQLFTHDLRPGDLMLQAPSPAAGSRAIVWLQRKAHQINPQVVHAGILFDNNYMVEALLEGITANDLRVQNAAVGYMVYRPKNGDLARRAAKCAKAMFEIHQNKGNLPYPLLKRPDKMVGALSADSGKAPEADALTKLYNRIADGETQYFYCSQFVVFVYQYAGELAGISPASIFASSAARTSPSTLAQMLVSNHAFEEAGYLMPGERIKAGRA